MSTQALYIPLHAEQPGAIPPELLANKLAALRRLQLPDFQEALEHEPRLIEAHWHIQAMSKEPGGLKKFAREFLPHIQPGTKSMRRLGQRKYTLHECQTVWKEMPSEVRSPIQDKLTEEHGPIVRESFDCEDNEAEEKQIREQIALNRAEWNRALEKTLLQLNEPYFRKLCHEAAEDGLARFLERACGTADYVSGDWWCQDIFGALLQFIDERAKQIEARIAPTAVTVKVFDALDYANGERVMVRISGDARFGKTESVETRAAMWPGRFRVVRTPSSNSDKDLQKAIAEAFGIQHGHGVNSQNLRDKVEFVIRFGGLTLIFDEAAWLVPSSFSATTPPARLNWVRSAIVDRKIGCVLVVTPQSYASALNRFVKKTQYSIEQFLGREALRFDLPNELSREDLLAVARIHFPQADEDLLGLIVAKAMQSESYLKAVENIARRARYIATKRGAKRLSLRDVDAAIDDVMPAPAPAAPTPLQRGRSHAARVQMPLKAERISSITGHRNTTPIEEDREVAAAG